MVMLVYAKSEEEVFVQKFLTESDMNNFIEENAIIVLGSKILN